MPNAAPKHRPLRVEARQHVVSPSPEDNWGKGRGGRPWRRIRDRILARDEGLCQECKRNGLMRIAHEVDHIKPRSQGGTDRDENLEALCRTHHRAKTYRERCGTGSKRGGVA